jgi:hypothetical protein
VKKNPSRWNNQFSIAILLSWLTCAVVVLLTTIKCTSTVPHLFISKFTVRISTIYSGYISFNFHRSNTMIFLTGCHQEHNVLMSTPLPLRGQSKGRGAIRMPWAMSLWRGLVQLLQLAVKEQDDNDNDGATSTKQRQ